MENLNFITNTLVHDTRRSKYPTVRINNATHGFNVKTSEFIHSNKYSSFKVGEKDGTYYFQFGREQSNKTNFWITKTWGGSQNNTPQFTFCSKLLSHILKFGDKSYCHYELEKVKGVKDLYKLIPILQDNKR